MNKKCFSRNLVRTAPSPDGPLYTSVTGCNMRGQKSKKKSFKLTCLNSLVTTGRQLKIKGRKGMKIMLKIKNQWSQMIF